MKLYACGFNAHHQLSGDLVPFSDPPQDHLSFRLIATASDIRVLFAGWSATVLAIDDKLHISGAAGTGSTNIRGDPEDHITSVFGDHNGPKGGLASNGLVYWLDDDELSLGNFHFRPLAAEPKEASPILHVAILGTGHVAVIPNTAPKGKMSVTHITTFRSLAEFKSWYRSPTSEDHYPVSHHMISSSPKQLVAGSTFFTLLTDAGDVWTWAIDTRYSHCLARPISKEHPAEKPGRVDSLLGIQIKKVDAGGWLGAAVADSNDLYIWGGHSGSGMGEEDGEEGGTIAGLPADNEAVQLVELGDGVDVVDVGVGAAHIVALDEKGRVWTVGAGENGQLSRGEAVGFQKDWELVNGLEGEEVVAIAAGDRSSFALVKD